MSTTDPNSPAMPILELRHLAPYLPYELKILNGWGDIKTLNYTHLDDEGNGFIKHVKPFLRPMSDLTKEIEINGIRFEPSYWFEICDDENDSLEFDFGNINLIKQIEGIAQNECHHDLQFLPYFVINKFFEWHFDAFGLIPSGLAIDINELNKPQS